MKKYQAIEPSFAFSAKIEPRAESFVPWITRPSWYMVWALAMVPSVAPPAVGCTAQTIAPVSLLSATTRLPAAVVKTLPWPTLTPRWNPPGPKPLAAVDGCHFHLTAPVAPSSAITPPAGVSTYMTPSTTIGAGSWLAVELSAGAATGAVIGSVPT